MVKIEALGCVVCVIVVTFTWHFVWYIAEVRIARDSREQCNVSQIFEEALFRWERAESVQGAKELACHSGVRGCSKALMETGDRSAETIHTPLSVMKTSYGQLSQLPDSQ